MWLIFLAILQLKWVYAYLILCHLQFQATHSHSYHMHKFLIHLQLKRLYDNKSMKQLWQIFMKETQLFLELQNFEPSHDQANLLRYIRMCKLLHLNQLQ